MGQRRAAARVRVGLAPTKSIRIGDAGIAQDLRQWVNEGRILATPILASVSGWAAFRVIARIPRAMRARPIAATMEDLVDLCDDIDPRATTSIPRATTYAAGATRP